MVVGFVVVFVVVVCCSFELIVRSPVTSLNRRFNNTMVRNQQRVKSQVEPAIMGEWRALALVKLRHGIAIRCRSKRSQRIVVRSVVT